MARIQIDPDRLETAAGRLKSLGDSIREEKKEMSGVKEGVAQNWQSRTSVIFTEGLETTERNMEKLAREAESLAGSLRSLANQARKIEKENADAFQRA